MAIQISGTTVIDNSRNIANVGIVTATSFSGNGSALTALVANAINGVSVYTSPGTFTVGTNCPSSITSIIAYACGGGGPGVAGFPSPAGGAGGGGGGSSMTGCYFIPTSNGQAFSITIGGVSGTTTITRGPATIASIPGGNATPVPAPPSGSALGGSAGSTDPLANFHLGGSHGGHGNKSDFTTPFGGFEAEVGGHGGNSYFGTGGKGGYNPESPGPTPIAATAGSGAGAGGGGGTRAPAGGGGGAGAPGQVVIVF